MYNSVWKWMKAYESVWKFRCRHPTCITYNGLSQETSWTEPAKPAMHVVQSDSEIVYIQCTLYIYTFYTCIYTLYIYNIHYIYIQYTRYIYTVLYTSERNGRIGYGYELGQGCQWNLLTIFHGFSWLFEKKIMVFHDFS